MGINILIDDFGTGFSSLASLKRLPIDALKIDQSFVRDATTDQDDAALVMAIITLAHNLRLTVIAEGVETEDQLRFLQLLRCDQIQGYFFSKPLPADSLLSLFDSHTDFSHKAAQETQK
jgi:EAL domain-containing protein (putative c-di-GMP-specific phosphodiesterase class I)